MEQPRFSPRLGAERLRAKGELDELDELAEARRESPEQRLALSLELCELTRELAEAASAAWTRSLPNDLPDKAALYAAPLRAAASYR